MTDKHNNMLNAWISKLFILLNQLISKHFDLINTYISKHWAKHIIGLNMFRNILCGQIRGRIVFRIVFRIQTHFYSVYIVSQFRGEGITVYNNTMCGITIFHTCKQHTVSGKFAKVSLMYYWGIGNGVFYSVITYLKE